MDRPVTLACREPGPSDRRGLDYLPLRGNRIQRNLRAARIVFRAHGQVLSLHDPELLPLGVLASLAGRAVVFDLHEDVPAQILTKDWIWPWARRPLAWTVAALLRIAERTLTVTLAEGSYQRLFVRPHTVIANYPIVDTLPTAEAEGAGVVYVGDVTRERGLYEAAEACAAVGLELTIVGPVREEVERDIRAIAGRGVTLTGRLSHAEAMRRVASASIAVSPLRDLPNYRHSVPTKVIEYLAVGVPVVASDLPATREVTRGLEAVHLHTPGDVSSLAECLSAISDADRAAAGAQAGEVRRRYSWPAEALAEVYDAVGGR